MFEVKDPAIKLFGKTIQLVSDEAVTAIARLHDEEEISIQKHSSGELGVTKKDIASNRHIIHLEDHLICSATTSSAINEDPKTPAAEKESPNKKDSSNPNETNTTTSDEKTLKRPDKILPCPRCNSMDTKFCYYNNYNVSQPRHFCRNCQRYWTAGGTMRNVPVGSGRRKNKTSPSSHYRHIMVSETLPAQADGSVNGPHLAFGSDSDKPLCESMASVLNLDDKSTNNVPNKICIQERNNEKWENCSSGNSLNPCPPHCQIPCFPAPPWPNPWNSGLWTNQMLPTGFVPWTYPVPFYPIPQYWGYTAPTPWSMPLLSPKPCSSDYSLTLGKHYRDGSNEEDKYSDRGVVIPKTLRINDPNDAAKCSIWSTLGINNENGESTGGSNRFKAFQPKCSNEKDHTVEASPVLHANPAAMSRSLNFHETS